VAPRYLDEALTMVAEKLLDNIYNHGPDTNSFFSVIPAMSPVSFCAGSRWPTTSAAFSFFLRLVLRSASGEPLTWVCRRVLRMRRLVQLQIHRALGSNISQTRIPTRISPTKRATTAPRSSAFRRITTPAPSMPTVFRINPGTDGILALGVAKCSSITT